MSNANRAAINTIINYVQLGLNVVISVFTIRLILRSLGEIDYGIYSLIAGVITIISFVSESLSQTSIRFISVSLGGSREPGQVQSVFSSCFSLHFYMAVLMVVLLELIGFFLFDGFLNIPEQRLEAARIVYHCMVISLFASILSTPFRAIIIAQEKFSYIAIVGILESILKLLVAVCVFMSSLDRLILYGFLMSLISFSILLCFIIIVKRVFSHFISCHLTNLNRFGQMAKFAGWTLLDVFATISNRQGYAIMLNKFYGPSTNAVFALAQHVESPLFFMSSSAINSIRPQILKSYGDGDIERTLRLSFSSGKIGFSLMALIAIPVFVMLPDVLSLWLGEYPEDTVFFARMMIIASMINQISLGLVTANQAFGKIKWFSIIVSTVRMSALPISIIFLLFGGSARTAMVVYMAFESLASICRVIVMNKLSGISIKQFMKDVILDISIPVGVSVMLCFIIYRLFNGLWGLIAATLVSVLAYSLSLYLFGLTKEERLSINSFVISIKGKFLSK